MARVDWPPPDNAEGQNSIGSNIERPGSTSTTKQPAGVQWSSPALAKPRDFRSWMRSPAQAVMSVFVPNRIAPVGHALTQAGSSPTPTRSEHKVHLYDL